MSSSLFTGSKMSPQAQQPSNDLLAAVNEVKRQIGTQDPRAVLQQICAQDPQARAFVQSLQNMNPMQLAAQFFKTK